MPYEVCFSELNDETAQADGVDLTADDLQDAHRCVEAVQRAHNARCARGRRRLSPGCAGGTVIDTDTGEVLAEPITKG